MAKHRRVELTLAEATKFLRSIGISLTKRDGEYLVRPRGLREGEGTYYTNEIDDAVGSGVAMSLFQYPHNEIYNKLSTDWRARRAARRGA